MIRLRRALLPESGNFSHRLGVIGESGAFAANLAPAPTKGNQGQIQGVVTWQLYAISVARDQALVTMSLTQSAALVAVGIQIFKVFAP